MTNANLIDSLARALEATPDNTALRLSLIRLVMDEELTDDLVDYVEPLAGAALESSEDRALAGAAFLAIDDPANALAILTGNEPAERIERARALVALGRQDDALADYRAAVASNPALEDPSLKAQLSATVVDDPNRGGIRLRVISNDDTDADDVTRLLIPQEERITFADVHGLDAVKQEVRRKIILPYLKPSLFQKFRKRVGGGLLLYGPPGCGKTLLARATAGECNAQFFNVMISDVLDMYIGESERKLHALFETVRQNTPAVIFFDEIEAIGAKRQYARESHTAKMVSQFLSEMDGFSRNNDGVLILGATNVPWAIDPAFRRPGRFDRTYFVPPPDREAREAILKMEMADRPARDNIDFAFIARSTSGYSGADLKNIVEIASDTAIEATIDRGEEVPIEDAFLKEALGLAKSTTMEWLTTAKNYARYANDGGQYNDVLDFLRKHGKP